MKRRYRCPYCRSLLEELPAGGACPICRRMMRLPAAATRAERTARRRKREQIRRDGEQRRAEIGFLPEPRLLRSPKILFGAMLVFTVLGVLLVRRAKPLSRAQPRIPHQVALQQLDTLATALGRYRHHVGDYPTTGHGLVALLNNPGVAGWNGPYINQLLPDPWGTPYLYERGSNSAVRLLTCGPDRQAGTPDDLRPDPAAFDPGSEWTNEWTSAINRQPGAYILQQLTDK